MATDFNRRSTVLLVDDEPLILDVCGAVLGNAGFDVLCSRGGDAGLKTFRANADAIDLVISDIVMPGLNGPDMTRTMLAEKPGLRILYISGYGAGTIVPEGNGPVVSLLNKPFTSDQLLSSVRALLSGRASVFGEGGPAKSRMTR